MNKTKVYRVPVSSPDNTEMFSIKAIGILCIGEEVSAVQLKPIAKLLSLENDKTHRGKGPVDLLIGIDHAQMAYRTDQAEWTVSCKTNASWMGGFRWTVKRNTSKWPRLSHTTCCTSRNVRFLED